MLHPKWLLVLLKEDTPPPPACKPLHLCTQVPAPKPQQQQEEGQQSMYRAPPSGTKLNWRGNGERLFLHGEEQNSSLPSAPRQIVRGTAALRGGKMLLGN